jgi:YD repeat-containing protein
LASYAYLLGPAGNRTQVTELSGRQVNYTYDSLYRLKSETIANDPSGVNGLIGYQYDAVGNRNQRTSTVAPVSAASYTYDADDRLNTDTYDANGSTIASNGKTYTYDFENHLISQGTPAVSITYDGDGNRVSETVSGVTTRYLVDDRNLTGYAQVFEELSSGSVQRVYSYGLSRISQSQASGTSFYAEVLRRREMKLFIFMRMAGFASIYVGMYNVIVAFICWNMCYIGRHVRGYRAQPQLAPRYPLARILPRKRQSKIPHHRQHFPSPVSADRSSPLGPGRLAVHRNLALAGLVSHFPFSPARPYCRRPRLFAPSQTGCHPPLGSQPTT